MLFLLQILAPPPTAFCILVSPSGGMFVGLDDQLMCQRRRGRSKRGFASDGVKKGEGQDSKRELIMIV